MFIDTNNIKNSNVILFLLFLWLIILALVNPIGNFPLGDDWAYAKPVKNYLDTGILRLTDWGSMTLVMHVFLGIIVSKIFGFSFTVLRFLTLIFSLFGSIGTYFFSKEAGIKKNISLLISILILFNPVYLSFSFSYMTDVSFFSIMIWALFFIIKFFRNEKTIYFIISLILTLIALLIRDLAIVFPIAFGIAYFYKSGFKIKNILHPAISIIVIFCVYLCYYLWIIKFNGMPKSMESSHGKILALWLAGIIKVTLTIIKNCILSLFFIGFYFFPILITYYIGEYKSLSGKSKFILSIINIILIFVVVLVNVMNPIQSEALKIFMFSPILQAYFSWPDVNLPSREYAPTIPLLIVLLINAIGIIGGFIILKLLLNKIIELFRKIKTKAKDIEVVIYIFVFIFILIYLIPVFSHNFCNRYLYLLLPLTLGFIYDKKFIIPVKNRLVLAINIILILWISYFAIAASHDWISFNRARWQGAEFLMRDLKISPSQIDGGFEFNGWYTFDYDYSYNQPKDKNFWWVKGNSYYIGWGKSPYYDVKKEIPYERYYPPFRKAIMYIQKRKLLR